MIARQLVCDRCRQAVPRLVRVGVRELCPLHALEACSDAIRDPGVEGVAFTRVAQEEAEPERRVVRMRKA